MTLSGCTTTHHTMLTHEKIRSMRQENTGRGGSHAGPKTIDGSILPSATRRSNSRLDNISQLVLILLFSVASTQNPVYRRVRRHLKDVIGKSLGPAVCVRNCFS